MTLFLSAGQHQDFPLIGVRFQTFWVMFLIFRESYQQRVCHKLQRKPSLEMGLGKIPDLLGMIPSSFGNYKFSYTNKVGADKVVFLVPEYCVSLEPGGACVCSLNGAPFCTRTVFLWSRVVLVCVARMVLLSAAAWCLSATGWCLCT